jgi:hypothetical protein
VLGQCKNPTKIPNFISDQIIFAKSHKLTPNQQANQQSMQSCMLTNQ